MICPHTARMGTRIDFRMRAVLRQKPLSLLDFQLPAYLPAYSLVTLPYIGERLWARSPMGVSGCPGVRSGYGSGHL